MKKGFLLRVMIFMIILILLIGIPFLVEGFFLNR
jgi:hypothetical protein